MLANTATPFRVASKGKQPVSIEQIMDKEVMVQIKVGKLLTH